VEPQVGDKPKLQNVVTAAKPNLSDAETRELEELFAE
jgi:hypothetical protein